MSRETRRRGPNKRMYPRVCELCGEPYVAHQDGGSHYCSKRCGKKAREVFGRIVKPGAGNHGHD